MKNLIFVIIITKIKKNHLNFDFFQIFPKIFFSMKKFCRKKINFYYIDVKFSEESIFRILGAIQQVFHDKRERKNKCPQFCR